MEHLQVLLIQLRKDLFTKQEEYLRFLVTGHLAPTQLDVWDVFLTPDYDYTQLSQYDAVFMGGSSDDPDDTIYFEPDRYPFADNLSQALRYLKDKKIPVLASCMGFHAIHQALGGEIVLDVEHMESGTYEFSLNDAGMNDPLFDDMPAQFPVVSYHKKRSETLPPGAIGLGSTELCKYQAFRWPGQLFYAFQFHPELDPATVAKWAKRYQLKYGLSDEYVKELETNQTDVSISSGLVSAFLRLVSESQHTNQ